MHRCHSNHYTCNGLYVLTYLHNHFWGPIFFAVHIYIFHIYKKKLCVYIIILSLQYTTVLITLKRSFLNTHSEKKMFSVNDADQSLKQDWANVLCLL